MTKERLASVANSLAECGKVLIQLSSELAALADGGDFTPGTQTQNTAPETVADTASVGATAEKTSTLSLEAVRKVAAEKARDGFTEEVRDLIQKFGAHKLSEIPVVKYADFLTGLEAMHHAG